MLEVTEQHPLVVMVVMGKQVTSLEVLSLMLVAVEVVLISLVPRQVVLEAVGEHHTPRLELMEVQTKVLAVEAVVTPKGPAPKMVAVEVQESSSFAINCHRKD